MELKLVFVKFTPKKEVTKFTKPWPWGGMIPTIGQTISYGDLEGEVIKVKWDMKNDSVLIRIKQVEE